MNWLDQFISLFSPGMALRRVLAREALRSYDGGKLNRRTQAWNVAPESGDSPNVGEINRVRARSWDLYRNSPQVRKIVNSTVAHVVGRGMRPESQAITTDGMPDEEFRRSANRLWTDWTRYADAAGAPGRGGIDLNQMAQQAIREVVLSGECLVHVKRITKREMNRRWSPLPMVLTVIAAERLADSDFGFDGTIANGHKVFRGIEYNAAGQRVAYWLYDEHPNDPRGYAGWKSTRYDARDIIHIYIQDRPGQFRGVPWLAPVLLPLRDVDDLKQNEILASALRACVTMAIRRMNPGASFGLQGATGSSTVDANGNTMRRFQPGMLLEIGSNEEVLGTASQGPNVNVEAFATFITRGIAAAVPGLKSSTLTGDYRESSFSSERAAENDTWREVEILQEWFAAQFYQPIYESAIDTAIMSGILPYDPTYNMDPDNFTTAVWRGPVPKSINPVDDRNAALIAIQSGQDSLQNVVASSGNNWRDIIRSMAEVYEFAEQTGIDRAMIDKIYGVQPVQITDEADSEEEEEGESANAEQSSDDPGNR